MKSRSLLRGIDEKGVDNKDKEGINLPTCGKVMVYTAGLHTKGAGSCALYPCFSPVTSWDLPHYYNTIGSANFASISV